MRRRMRLLLPRTGAFALRAGLGAPAKLALCRTFALLVTVTLELDITRPLALIASRSSLWRAPVFEIEGIRSSMPAFSTAQRLLPCCLCK